MNKFFSLFTVFLFLSTAAYSQFGTLDNIFDTDGIVITDIDSAWDIGYDMVIQPDGKILVAGLITTSGEYDMGVVRYFSDGSLDTTFDNDGIVIVDFDTAAQFDQAFAIELQVDGKILIAGHSEIAGDNGFSVARLNSNGSLDNTFDGDGKKIMQLGLPGYDDFARDILIDNTGRIILVGEMQTASVEKDFALVRLHPDGVIDTTFGNNGIASANFSGLDDIAYAGVILTDGRIAVAGSTVVFSSTDYALAIFTSSGFLDNSFSANGKINTDFGAGNDFAYDIKQQGDGKLLLAGSSVVFGNKDITAARYLLTGQLDSTFNDDGKLMTQINSTGDDEANCLIIQPDNYIVFGGYNMTGGNKDFVLIRTDYNGIEDSTFGTNAVVTTNISGAMYDEVFALAIQPNDLNLVAAGVTGTADLDIAVTRYITGLYIGIEENLSISQAFVYPNPVEQTMFLSYNLLEPEHISIQLMDIEGKLINTYVNHEKQDAGKYQLELQLPAELNPGFYFLILSTPEKTVVIKIIHQ